jgi:hypothetical protein
MVVAARASWPVPPPLSTACRRQAGDRKLARWIAAPAVGRRARRGRSQNRCRERCEDRSGEAVNQNWQHREAELSAGYVTNAEITIGACIMKFQAVGLRIFANLTNTGVDSKLVHKDFA